MPGDVIRGVPLEVDDVESLPEYSSAPSGTAYRRSWRIASARRASMLSCSRASPGPPTIRRLGRVEQVFEQLRLPGIPHSRTGASNVGDRKQVQRSQAAAPSSTLAANASTTAGSPMSCFCAVADIIRCCSTSHTTRSVSSRESSCSRQKRRASARPSVEWSPPRPLAMSWNSPAIYSSLRPREVGDQA